MKTEDDKKAIIEIKKRAHEYANPKTKVLKTYTRLFDAFAAGAWSQYLQEKELRNAAIDKEINFLNKIKSVTSPHKD